MIDRNPRKFSPEQLDVLRDLAALVETELQRGQLSETQGELMRERDELKRRASIDGLTRLWNRSAIMDLLSAELARAKRGVPLCVAMMDADHFKKVNDDRGHPTGDAVLVELAARVRQAAREFDAIGRFGGEEFVGLFANCDLQAARAICERIRGIVADEPFQTPTGPLAVTVSIGVAAHDAERDDPERIVAAADAALYRAKSKGRNRVES